MASITRRHLVVVLAVMSVLVVVGVVAVLRSSRQARDQAPDQARDQPTTTDRPTVAAMSAVDCLARPDVLRLTGVRPTNFWDRRPADDKTYDLRGLVSTAYGKDLPAFPISIGIREVVADALGSPLTMDNDPGARACVLGGAVLGQMPRSLTWGDVKRGDDNRYDGDALQLQSDGWSVGNGFRVDNVEDGITPYGIYDDTMYVRNAYLSTCVTTASRTTGRSSASWSRTVCSTAASWASRSDPTRRWTVRRRHALR